MTVTIHEGDCLGVLEQMEDESVECVITSPPYWGLRDYGVAGQIGLEHSIHEHLETLIAIFEQVKRVLKPDGILWVNYGDCYATTPSGRKAADIKNDDRGFVDKPFSTIGPVLAEAQPSTATRSNGGKNENYSSGLTKSVMAGGYVKPKDMCLLPERFVIAMQDAGWWVRAKPIWAKNNPMPESAKDRPTTSYEQIYMFTKSQRYRYDHEAVRLGLAKSSISRLEQDIENQKGSDRAHAGGKTNGRMKAVGGWASGPGSHSVTEHNKGIKKSASFKRENSKRGKAQHGQNNGTHRPDRPEKSYQNGTRSLRQWEAIPPIVPPDIWEIPTKPFKEAHFATFPPELVYRCLMASGCKAGDTILDPFGGAGTTGLVADRLQMNAVMIELNPEYIDIARRRIEAEQGLFPAVEVVA